MNVLDNRRIGSDDLQREQGQSVTVSNRDRKVAAIAERASGIAKKRAGVTRGSALGLGNRTKLELRRRGAFEVQHEFLHMSRRGDS